jgi:hypothetical protein
MMNFIIRDTRGQMSVECALKKFSNALTCVGIQAQQPNFWKTVRVHAHHVSGPGRSQTAIYFPFTGKYLSQI